ncbi:MAG TPA: hypothetical protein VE010_18025, partial [Thermoanaerobaculia bacterium]|nr:hypothetical protein [Thermoanaerobaculia bacterium]
MTVTVAEPRPAVRAIQRVRRRHRRQRRALSPFVQWMFLASGSAVTLTLLLASHELRLVLGPLLAIAFLTLFSAVVLYRRDGQLPVFEPASFCVAATCVYAIFPLINFIAGGLRWHPLTDFRLLLYDPGPREVAAFGWRYALYLACLVATYLIVRGRRAVLTTSL